MRKKSVRKAASDFKSEIVELSNFLSDLAHRIVTEKSMTWAYEYAVIRLHREFENLMLNCLVAGINNDTTVLSSTTGIQFPKHLTDEICEYLVIGGGYFDFKGRDGLIATLKKFVPADHYLVSKVKDRRYKDSLNKLSALRNFAAHDSAVAKRTATKQAGVTRLASSGAWLKKRGRFETLCDDLKRLADEIAAAAPR